MLFTGSEQREIWNRLKSGRKCKGDALLIHTVSIAHKNIRNAEQLDPTLAQKMRVVYRLVQRGLITTSPKFNQVAKDILR